MHLGINRCVNELHSLYQCSDAVKKGQGCMLGWDFQRRRCQEETTRVSLKQQTAFSATAHSSRIKHIRKMQCRNRYRELHISPVRSNPRGSILDMIAQQPRSPHLPLTPSSLTPRSVHLRSLALVQFAWAWVRKKTRFPPTDKAKQVWLLNKPCIPSSWYSGIHVFSEVTHLLCRQGLGLKSECWLPVP